MEISDTGGMRAAMGTENLFALPAVLPVGEFVELLAQQPGVRIERIISAGHASAPGFWYDQDEDEWVAVLQGTGTLQWEDGRVTPMAAGDWLLIPARKKHRVEYTSQEPPCVWLAVFLINQQG